MGIQSLLHKTRIQHKLRSIRARFGDPPDSSAKYWEQRYRVGGDSGQGSYGRLAAFKAGVLNSFVSLHHISSVVELGCGDGAQLSLANYPSYIGIDVAPKAIDLCRGRFGSDSSKQFAVYDDVAESLGSPPFLADLSLSLDVIFHLIEDDVWHQHLIDLFRSSTTWVIIYSSDSDESDYSLRTAWHIKHRPVLRSVQDHFRDWECISKLPNIFPGDGLYPPDSSFSSFYFFKKSPQSNVSP